VPLTDRRALCFTFRLRHACQRHEYGYENRTLMNPRHTRIYATFSRSIGFLLPPFSFFFFVLEKEHLMKEMEQSYFIASIILL
jgi:hypothetical protein